MDAFFESENLSVDNLTKLYNRNVIVDYVEHLIEEKTPFSMALVDIDNFKYINDNYGHIAGDKIICEVANRIKSQLGNIGEIGRFGGDEFIIVLKNITNYDEVWNVCHRILVNMSEVEISDFGGLYVTVTIGLARFPENALSYEKLLETADKALYRGKMKGRNCFIIYLPEKHANIVLKTEKEKQLSSMYLHSIVFSHITRTENLAEGIKGLFDFISSYYMIDHLCIQTGEGDGGNLGKLYFEKVHQLARNKTFKPINLEFVKHNLNKTIEMFYLNDVKHLMQSHQIEFYESLCEQQITSTCYVDISYQGESFGMLRADMTGLPDSHRIWQYEDMDILLTTGKVIALVLHFTNRTIKDLEVRT